MGDAEPKTRDLVSSLAMIGVPLYLFFRLLTGGWVFALVLLLVCVVLGVVYWRFGLAREAEDDSQPWNENPPPDTE